MTACPACGHPERVEGEACPACGAREGPQRTLFGVPSPVRPPAGGAAPPVVPEEAQPDLGRHTLLGVPGMRASAPPAESSGAHATILDLRPPVLAEEGPQRTLFGRAVVEAPADEPPAEAASQRTLFGRAVVAAQGSPADSKQTIFGRAVATPAEPAPAPPAEPAPAPPAEPAPAPPAEPAPPPRRDDPVAAAERREAVELYAVAKYAAAIAADQRIARRRRFRLAVVVLAVAAVAAVVAAGLVMQARNAFRAELGAELSVVRDGGRYHVEVEVRTSAPATVRHPGGESAVEGAQRILFSVPESDLVVGDNAMQLDVVPAAGGDARALVLRVVVYYRLRAPSLGVPRAGEPVPAELEVLPGWSVEVAGGTAADAGDGRWRLALDPAPLLARVDALPGPEGDLPVALTLRGPAGEVQRFTERLRLPLPTTPLVVVAPPHGWVAAADAVAVEGVAVPGARVRVGEREILAGPDGAFALEVPLAGEGPLALALEVDAPGRRPTTSAIEVRRLAAAAVAAETAALKVRAEALLGGAAPTPPYRALAESPDAHRGRAVKLSGELVSIRRGEAPGRDEAQIATCRAGCPVWADVEGPVLVAPGARVTVVGTLAGLHTWSNRAGETITAPRLGAALLLP